MKLLYFLNIIDRIYEHPLFPKILTGSIITLIVLFLLILLLGLKDAHKSKNPPKIEEDDIKDITFNVINEQEKVKEDVTFEIPVLTKNLEDFKKNLEEEIQKESEIKILKTVNTNQKEEKASKILDMNQIEDTAIIPVLEENEIERLYEETEEPKKDKKTKESKKVKKSEK